MMYIRLPYVQVTIRAHTRYTSIDTRIVERFKHTVKALHNARLVCTKFNAGLL